MLITFTNPDERIEWQLDLQATAFFLQLSKVIHVHLVTFACWSDHICDQSISILSLFIGFHRELESLIRQLIANRYFYRIVKTFVDFRNLFFVLWTCKAWHCECQRDIPGKEFRMIQGQPLGSLKSATLCWRELSRVAIKLVDGTRAIIVWSFGNWCLAFDGDLPTWRNVLIDIILRRFLKQILKSCLRQVRKPYCTLQSAFTSRNIK